MNPRLIGSLFSQTAQMLPPRVCSKIFPAAVHIAHIPSTVMAVVSRGAVLVTFSTYNNGTFCGSLIFFRASRNSEYEMLTQGLTRQLEKGRHR